MRLLALVYEEDLPLPTWPTRWRTAATVRTAAGTEPKNASRFSKKENVTSGAFGTAAGGKLREHNLRHFGFLGENAPCVEQYRGGLSWFRDRDERKPAVASHETQVSPVRTSSEVLV